MSTAFTIHFGTDGWRAVIGDDFTYANLRRVADAAGRVFAADHPGGTVLVGYDTRFEAGSFAAAAAEVLASHGLTVLVSDALLPDAGAVLVGRRATRRRSAASCSPRATTPRRTSASSCAWPTAAPRPSRSPTASRPSCATSRPLPAARSRRRPHGPVPRGPARIRRRRSHPLRRPQGRGRPALRRRPRSYLADTLRSLGVEVTEIHGEANPGFGGLHPEPIPPHIDEVRALVRDRGLDAAFITDGDADRIGAADRTGAFVNPHRIIALVARHLIEDRGMTGRIVKTLSTSVLVDRLARLSASRSPPRPSASSGSTRRWSRAASCSAARSPAASASPSHVRERDGLLMALLLAEMMAQRGRGLGELVDDLLALTGPMEYGRNDLRLDAAVKDAFVASWPTLAPAELAGLPVRDIVRADGIKFLLPDDAWLLMRASGTEPLVRVYAEASSAGVVDDLLAAGRAMASGAKG